jgi:eukaryotic-like serine/threonine-protein kinase
MASPLPPVPNKLEHFEIVRRLGAGGMAEVFLAKKRGAEGTFKVLVVKRILPSFGNSRRFKTMFIEEAQLATRLNHPNVVQVYDFFDAGDEGHILAMEFVEGLDLGALMHAARNLGTRIGPWVSAWIVAEAAKGLHYAHEKKDEQGQPLDIVHRDVSPQNVLLSFEGGVKITDFGIASARLTEDQTGVIKGKFGYMSPEQARGERIDRRSDLYALGVILWECLTGRPLHGGLGGEALLDIVRSGEVERPSQYVRDLPEELEKIVMKLLEREREHRYASGKELASAVARALLHNQELVDSVALESRIFDLVPQSERAAVDEQVEEEARTNAAAPVALHQTQGRQSARVPSVDEAQSSSREPREVRHVVLVSLHLGFPEGTDRTDLRLLRALSPLRKTLGEMAYKRGMRWVWQSEFEARAIAGLSAKHGRAASDAAMLTLDTHEAIAGYGDDLPTAVTASVSMVRGIASGARDADGNLVRFSLHEPVTQLADILSGATPKGATWVAGGLYRLIRRDFLWDAPHHLSLTGKSSVSGVPLPSHVRTYGLLRALSRDERASEAGHLIGRDAELADLQAAFHSARKVGHERALVRAVVGELGIGKTALVSAFLEDAVQAAQTRSEGLRILRVECTPVSMEVPFGAVSDLVRDAIGANGGETFEEMAERIASLGGGAAHGDASHPAVARLAELAANSNRARGSDEDAVDQRKVIVSALRTMLGALAIAEPLIVTLDGFQWADRQSLDLFTDILRSPDPLPMLTVVVTRPDDRVSALLQGHVRVELDPLTADEQVRLLEARLGVREGVRAVCADLMPRVGGNPYFLLEMVDALLERGVLEIVDRPAKSSERASEEPRVEARASGATGDGGAGLERTSALVRTEQGDLGQELPSTLEQLVADRLQELPREERVIVDWLAVAGGPLHEKEIGELSSILSDDPITRLCARGMCDRKGNAIDFRHPLIRDVAYAALGGDLRVRMHAELGELLAETPLARGLSAAVVARHLVRGNLGVRAVDYYLEAALAARSSHQLQLAARYFRRALTHMLPRDRRSEIALDALETIYRALGRRHERVQALDGLRTLAKQLGTPRLACVALTRLARYHLDEGLLVRGLPIAKAATSLAQNNGMPQLSVETEALLSEFLRELGDVQGALAACDRALSACDPKLRRGSSARTYAEVLRARGVLLRRVGRVREAVDAYADALAYAKAAGAKRLEARTKNALAYAMFVQGRYEDAIVLAHESIQIDLSMGGRFQVAKTLTNIGHSYSRLGDVPRAQAYLSRAREAHERYGDQDSRADTHIVCAEVALEVGDIATGEGFLRDAQNMIAVTRNAYDATHALLIGAVLSRAKRDPKRAIAQALEARRAAETQALVAYSFYGMSIEATARVDAGEIHTGTLLATTALGTVETLQGCEYGLEIRVLCADALKRAGSPQAGHARQVAIDYTVAMLGTIRDARLRRTFAQRPIVAALFDATPVPEPARTGTTDVVPSAPAL